MFDAVLAALIAADREIHAKAASSEFHVCSLSPILANSGSSRPSGRQVRSAASAIALFRRCAGRVYRSDYRILLQYRRLMRAFQRIVAALDPAYCRRRPLSRQRTAARRVLPPPGRPGRARRRAAAGGHWFAGSVIMSFDGRLEAIDYRGARLDGPPDPRRQRNADRLRVRQVDGGGRPEPVREQGRLDRRTGDLHRGQSISRSASRS